jgi:hypothetical protein
LHGVRGRADHTVRRLRPVGAEYVGLAFVLDAEGDETDVRASLRIRGRRSYRLKLIVPLSAMRS